MSTKPAPTASLSSMLPVRRQALLVYGAALTFPILTLLLRLMFWDYIPGLPFVTFIPSVALVAMLGGARPATVTAVFSATLGLLYLAEPWPFGPGSEAIWLAVFVYAVVCAILIMAIHQSARMAKQSLALELERAAVRENALQARLEAVEATAERGRIERRLEVLTDALPVLIAQVGPDRRYQFVNRAYVDWFGQRREDLIGRRPDDILRPDVFPRLSPHIEAALSGEHQTFEVNIPNLSGKLRDVQVHYVPNLGPNGETEGYFSLAQDITEAKRQADLLAQRERHLWAVMESVTDCFYAVDRDWRITLFNRAAERYYGMAREDVLGRKLWDAFPAHRGSVFERHLQHVMYERVPVTFEAQSVVFPDRYIEMRVSPKEGSGLAVSFSNITERKRAEHHRELLIRELNHRVKNTLAVVQSIAAQSLRDTHITPETRAAFEGRLVALASAHDLLTQGNWEATQLRCVAAVALRPFGIEDRFELEGPNLEIGPKAAVSLALALHELATNASKYGALSNQTGRVAVRWHVSDNKRPVLTLVWQERNGPPVTPPSKRGFGSRLLMQGLAVETDGAVILDYPTDGVICTIRAPLESLEPRQEQTA